MAQRERRQPRVAPMGAAPTGSIWVPRPGPRGFTAPVGTPRCPGQPGPVAGPPSGHRTHRGRAAAGEPRGAACRDFLPAVAVTLTLGLLVSLCEAWERVTVVARAP